MKLIKHITGGVIAYMLTAGQLYAQQPVLQKVFDKLAPLNSISYTANEHSNNLFGGSDQVGERKVVVFNRLADSSYNNCFIKTSANYGNFIYIGDGMKEIQLNYADSTYDARMIRTKNNDPEPLSKLISNLKQYASDGNYTIRALADSVIDGKNCYQLAITAADTAKKMYVNDKVFIDKATSLITCSRTNMQGEMTKGGMSLGIFKMISETYFTGYVLNGKPDMTLMQIPIGFKPLAARKPYLTKGTPAPNWELTSADGKLLSLASLKGKVVLIDFTFNGCPACMLALPSINKLHKKYDGTDVAIVTINTMDSKEEVKKFIKNNNIKTPIYINGAATAKIYNVKGAPIFYLINKNGEVSEVADGYYENFDMDMAAKIEGLR